MPCQVNMVGQNRKIKTKVLPPGSFSGFHCFLSFFFFLSFLVTKYLLPPGEEWDEGDHYKKFSHFLLGDTHFKYRNEFLPEGSVKNVHLALGQDLFLNSLRK